MLRAIRNDGTQDPGGAALCCWTIFVRVLCLCCAHNHPVQEVQILHSATNPLPVHRHHGARIQLRADSSQLLHATPRRRSVLLLFGSSKPLHSCQRCAEHLVHNAQPSH